MKIPKIIIAVNNQPSPQVTIKEYKHPKAITDEAYFVLHFSSFDCFLSSKVSSSQSFLLAQLRLLLPNKRTR